MEVVLKFGHEERDEYMAAIHAVGYRAWLQDIDSYLSREAEASEAVNIEHLRERISELGDERGLTVWGDF